MYVKRLAVSYFVPVVTSVACVEYRRCHYREHICGERDIKIIVKFDILSKNTDYSVENEIVKKYTMPCTKM